MIDERALLQLWEQALLQAGLAREASLARAVGVDPEAAPVGVHRLTLLRVFGRLTGATTPLRCTCPHCAEALTFDVEPLALCASLEAAASVHDGEATHELETHGCQVTFRLPTLHDLMAAPQEDIDDFVQYLLARCVLRAEVAGQPVAAQALSPAVMGALSDAMERVDPAACFAFDVQCPGCGHAWSAPFDVAQGLWAVLQGRAERLLGDVDTLARRYGWSEEQVLAVPPLRRQAYLQLAMAG